MQNERRGSAVIVCLIYDFPSHLGNHGSLGIRESSGGGLRRGAKYEGNSCSHCNEMSRANTIKKGIL